MQNLPNRRRITLYPKYHPIFVLTAHFRIYVAYTSEATGLDCSSMTLLEVEMGSSFPISDSVGFFHLVVEMIEVYLTVDLMDYL